MFFDNKQEDYQKFNLNLCTAQNMLVNPINKNASTLIKFQNSLHFQ